MKKGYSKGAFIDIEVKSFSNSKRRLFNTPTYLLVVTEIDDASLEGLIRGKDYIVVHVATNSLKCFGVFTCRRGRSLFRDHCYERRGSDDIRYVNLFDDKHVSMKRALLCNPLSAKRVSWM